MNPEEIRIHTLRQSARTALMLLPRCPEVIEALHDIRREEQAHREAMLGFQKACAQDRETSRYFKGEAADALKFYRAACLLLGWVDAAAPGDCPTKKPADWPLEVIPQVVLVAGFADVRACAKLYGNGGI